MRAFRLVVKYTNNISAINGCLAIDQQMNAYNNRSQIVLVIALDFQQRTRIITIRNQLTPNRAQSLATDDVQCKV